jgi:thioredoxin reductase (NADPH)
MSRPSDTDDPTGKSSSQLSPESDVHTSRRQQKYPVLTEAEIARISRFGEVCHWPDGSRIFKVADPGFGMYVVLSGRIKVTRRDAFDRQLVINEQGVGHFVSEVGQISSGRCLVDGDAAGDVHAIHVPPERLRALLIAEAELGERLLRADPAASGTDRRRQRAHPGDQGQQREAQFLAEFPRTQQRSAHGGEHGLRR